MNLSSVYRRQDLFALNNYIADVVEEIIPGRGGKFHEQVGGKSRSYR